MSDHLTGIRSKYVEDTKPVDNDQYCRLAEQTDNGLGESPGNGLR